MLWTNVLRQTDLRQLASFVSPTFFDVISARDLKRQALRLLANRRDRDRFGQVVLTRQQLLERAGLPVRLVADSSTPSAALSKEVQVTARRTVELFFHQIFEGDTVIVDLRARAFTGGEAHLWWQPSPLYAAWDPSFLRSIQGLYRGFYRDDPGLFGRSLDELDLRVAEDLFIEHFGGTQQHVRFRMKDFVDTFHAVFERCKTANVRLHADFTLLGFYLAALYDNLSRFDFGIDVSAAFHRATTQPEVRHAI